jgi:hypothetical protein
MRLRGLPERAAMHELHFASALPKDTVVEMDSERPLPGQAGPLRRTLGELRERPFRVPLAETDDIPVRVRFRVRPGRPFRWTATTIDQVVDDMQLGRMTFEVRRESAPSV